MGSENVLPVSRPRSSATPQRQVLSLRPLRPQTPLTSSKQESREGQSRAPEVEKPQIPRCHSSVALSGSCLPSAGPALTRGAPMSPGLKGKRWAV